MTKKRSSRDTKRTAATEDIPPVPQPDINRELAAELTSDEQIERSLARLDPATAMQMDRAEAIELVQLAREIEAHQAQTNETACLRRLLIAVLESMTPEQRAEVRRRLGG